MSSASLGYLNEAVAERDPNLISLPFDAAFDPVRGDPRYAAILARIHG